MKDGSVFLDEEDLWSRENVRELGERRAKHDPTRNTTAETSPGRS